MRIAVIGGGGMGSVFAARLASDGNDVVLVDRNADRVAEIMSSGLELRGPDEVIRARLLATTQAPNDPVDLVVLAVKAADVTTAARSFLPMLRPATVILTIQNGLGSAERVADVVPRDRLLVGIASGFGAEVLRPGVARHRSMNTVVMAPFEGPERAFLHTIAGIWRRAGFRVEVASDIVGIQWEKLVCNGAFSAQCALTGMTVGQVMDHPLAAAVARAAAREAWSVARALGVSMDVEDPERRVEEFAAGMPTAKPSALLDHERGRRSEVAAINGEISRHGRQAGVATPVNDTLVALVDARESLFAQAR